MVQLAQKSETVNSLLSRVAEKTGYPEKVIKDIVDSLSETMREELNNCHRVVLTGFGSFGVIKVRERFRHHPTTLQLVKIPSHNRIKFTVGQWGKKI